MRFNQNRNKSGFSLIELVIVVVMIAIIAAIAIPRMSRGAAGAADSALSGDLATLRKAIDLYAAEHGGTFPALATFETQLTTKTDANGTATGTLLYGPYLRSLPPLPVGAEKGYTAVAGTLGTAASGWVYNATTGVITANTSSTEKDAAGTLYSAY